MWMLVANVIDPRLVSFTPQTTSHLETEKSALQVA
jgi:hypothetical protein